MQIRRNSFAETGAASSFKNRIENHSNGICDLPGVDHIGDLTPFQNQVLDAAQRKEQEEKQRKQEEMRQQQGDGRPRNSRAGNNPTGGGSDSNFEQEETVRYINKDVNPDHEIHESD
jgi:hypothetical protein